MMLKSPALWYYRQSPLSTAVRWLLAYIFHYSLKYFASIREYIMSLNLFIFTREENHIILLMFLA